MLAGLMENSYERMWRFRDFFEHSSEICDLKYINVMNLDTCQIVELPMRKSEKYEKKKAAAHPQFLSNKVYQKFIFRLKELKDLIKRETKIDINSQMIIFNNLLIDSLVTEQQPVENYPIMDKQHPCVLFSLNSSINGDNLEIIKPS